MAAVVTRSCPQLPEARPCLTHALTGGFTSTVEQEVIPFAVVGSDQEYQVNGRRLLGRKTKWGTIEGKRCSLFHFRPPTHQLKHFKVP